ncbi:MAG: AAA family ATPase [Herpetosiphonaceae bacterium]|nr:AAA family ATPase [Herpetosiphonaceae bacterium]
MEENSATAARIKVVPLDLNLQISDRLTDLRAGMETWHTADRQLQHHLTSLDPNRRADVLRGSQIASVRRQLACQIIRHPIVLDPDQVRRIGLPILRHHLTRQYAHMSLAERRVWLTNLSFLLTPTLCALIDKLEAIRHYRSLGQQRCFLLGGVSGTGKSSLLNWYAVTYLPSIHGTTTHVPVIKIDAPVSNRSPKPFFQRILLACGAVTLRGDEEYYLQLLELYFQRCGVELLVVDEVEHITVPALRRRLLELSNLTGVPIVCASCNPIAWTSGDSEIQGRWNDYFELTQFTGPRLDAFLSLLEVLLPFEQDAGLGIREIVSADGQERVAGPAHYIEQWTDGIFREIMVLVLDACCKALDAGLPGVTLETLRHAWRDIKRAKVVNFLDYLRAQQGGHHG